LILLTGCEVPTSTDGSIDPDNPPPDGQVDNFLRHYVEDNFEGNGGSNFPHIKLYGTLFRGDLSDADKVWLANHYDIVDHGSWDFPERAKQVNPKILTTTHFNIAYANRNEGSSPLEDWILGKNKAYTLSDVLIDYREATQTNCGSFTAGDFLRQGKRCHWYTNDNKAPEWREWALEFLEETLFLGHPIARDGIMFDDVTFANDGQAWDMTDEYFGIDPASEEHPRIQENYESVGYLSTELERRFRSDLLYIVNIGNTYWLNSSRLTHRLRMAQEHAPNIQDETWVVVNSSVPAPRNYTDHYEMTILVPIRELMRKGHGYMFETGDYQNSDRGKRFTLGMFYLVNHPMAFYWYRVMGNHTGEPLDGWMWNPMVNTNLGQPMVNSLGELDFEGQQSNEHFILSQDETYVLLAREYTSALVIVKLMMSSAERPGQDPTTHTLPGSFRELRADGSASEYITEVTLENNDAVILLK